MGQTRRVQECCAVLDTAVAQFLGEHWLEAAEGCRAVAVEPRGVPAVSWVGFWDACRSSHAVAGRAADPSYQGSVPVPVLVPRARLRRRRWSR